MSLAKAVCTGSTITLTEAVPGGVWTTSDNNIANVTEDGGVVTGVSAGTTTVVYTVSDNNEITTYIIPVVVYPLPGPVTISVEPGVNIMAGQSVTMKANVSTAGYAPEYQWMVNGTPVAGATFPAFTSRNFANGDVVTCSVTSSTACSPAISDKVTITLVNSGGTINGLSVAEVNVIPNPNKGTFVIRGFLGTLNDEDVSLELTDMLGQVVYKNTVVAPGGILENKISLTNTLPNGMYVLNLRSGSVTKIFHIVIEQ